MKNKQCRKQWVTCICNSTKSMSKQNQKPESNENGCSQAAGLDTDNNQRVDAELYETEHLSMLLTLTGFTSQSSLLNHRSPEDTRMLVQTEKKHRSEGRQEASWCRCRKHLKSKRPAEICSAPRIQNIHNPACWWPTNTQYTTISTHI